MIRTNRSLIAYPRSGCETTRRRGIEKLARALDGVEAKREGEQTPRWRQPPGERGENCESGDFEDAHTLRSRHESCGDIGMSAEGLRFCAPVDDSNGTGIRGPGVPGFGRELWVNPGIATTVGPLCGRGRSNGSEGAREES